MTRFGMGLGMGLLGLLLIGAAVGCEDQEKRGLIQVGTSPTGTGGGGADGGTVARGGAPGGTATGSGGAATGDAGTPDSGAPDTGAGDSGSAAQPDLGMAPPDVGGSGTGGSPPNPLGNYAGKPWGGTPLPIPGIIEGEHYDTGGEGISFHDTDTVNRGNGQQNLPLTTPEATFRRAEAVDLSYTQLNVDKDPTGKNEPANQLYVGWTEPQEWVKYTVLVAETGNYMISSHCAVNSEGVTVSLSFEDGVAVGPLSLPRSGSFRTWHHVDNMAIIRLTAGLHVLTFRFDTAGSNLDYLSFIRKP